MGRVLLGAIVGGILMFVWGFLSHSQLHLVEKHIQELPREASVVASIRENVPEPGIYHFPWADFEKLSSDDAAMKAYEEKVRTGPVGILVRMPDGKPVMEPMQLVMEFATNVAAAFIAALVVAGIGASAPAPTKVVLVTLLGVFAWLSQDASYWIWHRHPTNYALATLVDATAGWFLAGIGVVVMARKKAPAR